MTAVWVERAIPPSGLPPSADGDTLCGPERKLKGSAKVRWQQGSADRGGESARESGNRGGFRSRGPAEASMEAPWRIELLGWLRATQGERVVTRFRSQKTGALLAYLAYHA